MANMENTIRFHRRVVLALGIAEAVIALLTLCFGLLVLFLEERILGFPNKVPQPSELPPVGSRLMLTETGAVEIWSAVLFTLAGISAIVTGRRTTKSRVIKCIVLSILSGCAAEVLLIMASYEATVKSVEKDTSYFSWPHIPLALFASVEVVLSIIITTLCGRVLCCGNYVFNKESNKTGFSPYFITKPRDYYRANLPTSYDNPVFATETVNTYF